LPTSHEEAILNGLVAGWYSQALICFQNEGRLKAQALLWGLSLCDESTVHTASHLSYCRMKSQQIRVLLVEADPNTAATLFDLATLLTVPQLALKRVSNLEIARQQLAENSFDVVVLGSVAPGHGGLVTFNQLHRAAPAVPVVVLTDATDNDDTSLLAVREGAQDYLVRGQYDGRVLARSLAYAIERKRTEVQLRQSEAFFRLISENVTDLIAVVDREGRRLYNNPAYERSLGQAGGLEGTDSFREVHPDDRDRIQRIFADTLATGVGRRAEYRMRLADGSIRHIESLGSVILDVGGQPDKVVVVSRDITERKQAMDELERTLEELKKAHEALKAAQAQLIQSEKLEALSTFAAAIAHEVRNPLQTMLLGIDFLRQSHDPNGTPDATVSMVLTDLENGARRADAVIQGLLEFTSYRSQQVADHDLSKLVRRALRTVEAELAPHSIRLSADLPSDLPMVHVDGQKIRHVLIKLFLGAVECLRAGGTLSVRTSVHPAGSTACRGFPVPPGFQPTDNMVVAEIEQTSDHAVETRSDDAAGTALIRQDELNLLVLKKVIELYGGTIHSRSATPGSSRILIMFRAHP
jgi:PAS domain S-box-containing protein